MDEKTRQFLIEMAALIEKYEVEIFYTTSDDGVHFSTPTDHDFFHDFVDVDTPHKMRVAAAV